MVIEIIITTTTFIASILTLYSGFGLSTILMPIFMIFFPVVAAIALAALVHVINNLFKIMFLWHAISWPITYHFGIPALLATIPGAWLLSIISTFPALYSYNFAGFYAAVTPVKLAIGALLIIFATLEWLPLFKNIDLTKHMIMGGILSGFFGGLSGHQGAFRSTFLAHAQLNPNQFIATNAAVSILVDITRLIVYGMNLSLLLAYVTPSIIMSAILASLASVAIGMLGLKKITMPSIQKLIVVMLYSFAILLIVGLL